MKNINKAFTLVELIVVIVILSILSTIAFLSFNNYSTSARDSRRMSNVTIISKGLDMSIALGRNINTSEAGTGMNILIVGSGGISYSGYYMNIGNKLLSSIQVSGGDILSDTFQRYQLTYIPDKKYYQVMGLLEKQAGTVYEENIDYFKLNNFTTDFHNYILPEQAISASTSSGYAFIKGNFPVNTASGGYIKGLIPKDYTNAPIINSIPTISGTGDIVIPAEIISSGGGYVTGGGLGTISPSSCTIGSYSGATTQTYNLPSTLNDSSSYTGTYNSGILNGTKTYTATMSCSNGTITVTNETYTGICDTNYNWNGSNCVSQYNGCNTPDIVLGNGQVWAACNLGSTIAGLSSSSYGNYYQWGRNVSGWISGWSAVDNAWGGITTTSTSGTWSLLSASDKLLIQGPCDTNYHVPTFWEWQLAYTNLGSNPTTLQNTLKIPIAGTLRYSDGSISNVGYGAYRSSTPRGSYVRDIRMTSSSFTYTNLPSRARGYSIRCLKN